VRCIAPLRPLAVVAPWGYSSASMPVLPFPQRTDLGPSESSGGKPHRLKTHCEACGEPTVRAWTLKPQGFVGLRCGACDHEWHMPERRAPRPWDL
jgi:hypothetical protein